MTETQEEIQRPTKTITIRIIENWVLQEVIQEVPMTDGEIVQWRIASLRYLVATWQATEQDREDLKLLIW